MWGHAPADFRLFANDHTLQDAGVSEAETRGDGSVDAIDRNGLERGVEFVEVVADFIDGAVLRTG